MTLVCVLYQQPSWETMHWICQEFWREILANFSKYFALILLNIYYPIAKYLLRFPKKIIPKELTFVPSWVVLNLLMTDLTFFDKGEPSSAEIYFASCVISFVFIFYNSTWVCGYSIFHISTLSCFLMFTLNEPLCQWGYLGWPWTRKYFILYISYFI